MVSLLNDLHLHFEGFRVERTVVRISLLRTAISAELPQRERHMLSIFQFFEEKFMFIWLFYALTIWLTMFENNSHKTIKIDLFEALLNEPNLTILL